MPTASFTFAVFAVLKNGSLVPLQKYLKSVAGSRGAEPEDVLEALRASGFNLTNGASETLTFSGQIQLEFGPRELPVQAIVPGEQYQITVFGDEALASTVVVASA